ncbi:MAG: exo-alpha-sialidase [Pirellulales bacterium]|nr:exo-alpha-sialidase [Pirellulales bacterium]
MHRFDRRQMLISTGAAFTAAVLTPGHRASAASAEIVEAKVISHNPTLYHGWPTVTRRKKRATFGRLFRCARGSRLSVRPRGNDAIRRRRQNMGLALCFDGLTWSWIARIPVRKGDDIKKYHELHAVETSKGTIVAQLRNHNKKSYRETIQTESTDGGKTWSVPHSIGVFGYPSHLLRLRDDRLLMTFGHRRKPYGNQARVSEDHGRTWSEPMILSGDAIGADMGYPSTVELDDGTLLSVWYELMRGSKRAVLRQARWNLKG